MSETLNQLAKTYNDASLNRTSQMIDATYDAIVINGNPDMQLDLFKSYFEDKVRTYVETGEDPIRKEDPNRSLIKEWVSISGSPFSSVDIVVGEGIDKKVIATAPSIVPKGDLQADRKTKLEITNFGEKYGHLQNGLMVKAERAMTEVVHTIKDKMVIDVEGFRKDWQSFFDTYNEKMGIKKDDKKEATSKEDKTQPQNDLDVYEF